MALSLVRSLAKPLVRSLAKRHLSYSTESNKLVARSLFFFARLRTILNIILRTILYMTPYTTIPLNLAYCKALNKG